MNKIEDYIKSIVSSLTCSPNEKQEIANEIRDHLYTSYEALLNSGHSPEDAMENAIKSFGQTHQMSIEFQQAVTPLFGWVRKLALVGFVLYSFVITCKLLLFRLIDRVHSYFFESYYSLGYVNAQTWLWTEKQFFDFSLWQSNVNFVPFKTIVFYIKAEHVNLDIAVNNLLGNFLLLLPLAMLLPFMFKRCQKLSSVAAIAFIVSFIIEALQFALQIGMADIDDVILNSIGAIVGYGFYKLIMWLLTLRIKFKNTRVLEN